MFKKTFTIRYSIPRAGLGALFNSCLSYQPSNNGLILYLPGRNGIGFKEPMFLALHLWCPNLSNRIHWCVCVCRGAGWGGAGEGLESTGEMFLKRFATSPLHLLGPLVSFPKVQNGLNNLSFKLTLQFPTS